MKLILNADETLELFENEKPEVTDVLQNQIIKQITNGFKVTSIYKDTMDTANLNNYVIELDVSK